MQRSNRRFFGLVVACVLCAVAAARAATINSATWLVGHWSNGGSNLTYYNQSTTIGGLSATETLTDVNLVVEHDHDDDPLTPIEWEEFTATSGLKSSTAGWSSKFGNSYTFSVTGYDNHHHPRVLNNPVVRIMPRAYLYDSNTGTTTAVDGPAVWVGCS